MLICKPYLLDIYKQMGNIIKQKIRECIQETVKNGDFSYLSLYDDDKLKIDSIRKKIEKKLKVVYKNVTGENLILPKIDIKIDPNIKDGKIGGFNHPDYNGDNGELGIKPKALKNMDYLEDVITHELIHAAIGDDLSSHQEHGELFNRIAEKMGLPLDRRD